MKKYTTASEAGLGRARGYADGGAVQSKYPNKVKGLTDEQIEANEARRPPGFDASMQQRAIPMPRSNGRETGDRMDADTSSNRPEFLRGKTPMKRGGRV